MRKLEFTSKTTRSVRGRAETIAWATERTGVNGKVWVGSNVTRDINDYLTAHDIHVDARAVHWTMKRLVDEGLAYIKYNDGGNLVVEFGFMADVDISGHKPPTRLHDPSVGRAQVEEVRARVDARAGAIGLPPLPAAPEKPIYRLGELEKLLRIWAEVYPELYAGWVDAAIENLEKRVS